MFVDYYTLLGIAQQTGTREIGAAYKRAALLWHPDRSGYDTTRQMQLLNEAKLILLDPEARARYDAEYALFQAARSSKAKAAGPTAKASHREAASPHEHADYPIHDDILAKWMDNARRQAREIWHEAQTLNQAGVAALKTDLTSSLRTIAIGSAVGLGLGILLIALSQ